MTAADPAPNVSLMSHRRDLLYITTMAATLLACLVLFRSESRVSATGGDAGTGDGDLAAAHQHFKSSLALQSRMRTVSGLPEIRCEARAPRAGGPNATQWCCLVPSRKQLRKVKTVDATVKAEARAEAKR